MHTKEKKISSVYIQEKKPLLKNKINSYNLFRILFLESNLRKSEAVYFVIVVLISNGKNLFMKSIYKAAESFNVFSFSNLKRTWEMYENFKILNLKIYHMIFPGMEYYIFNFIVSTSIFHFLMFIFFICVFFNGGHFLIPH